jgi:hypothetical protein
MASKVEVSIVEPTINENLEKVLEAEKEEVSSMAVQTFRWHRARGRVITRVKQGKSLDGNTNVDYGKNAVEILAERLGIHRSYAYKLSAFYLMYEDNQKFEDLLDLFRDSAGTISWGHFNVLVHVKDPEVRDQLIHKVAEENLSVAALRKEINQQKIETDEDTGEDTSSPAPLPPPPQEIVLEQTRMEEEDSEEESDNSTDSDSDSSPPINESPIKTLKVLASSAAKFGDKVVDLVGDLTISLADMPNGKVLKDVLKGISSSVEVMSSLQQQLGEYCRQLESMATTMREASRNDD